MGWPGQKLGLSVFLLLIIAATAFCDSGRVQWELENRQRIKLQIKAQKQRLEYTKQLAAEKRRQIEDAFGARLRNLRQRQDDFLNLLEQNVHNLFDGDRMLLSAFVKLYTNLTNADRNMTMDRYLSAAVDEASIYKSAGYRLIGIIDNGGLRPGTDIELKARALVEKAVDFEEELVELHAQKQAAIDRLAQWRQQQEQNILRTIDVLKTKLEKAAFGVVQAIGFDSDRPLVMINNRIVYQGGTINNITLTKITDQKVQFEKRDARWTQKIGEPAAEYWDN